MMLVTGATGRVGRQVVGGLRARGCAVVGMARDPDTARAVLPGVAVRIADYDDPAALRLAFGGIDALVFISSDGEADAVVRHHANVIGAAVAVGVRRVVFTSIVDCDAASPFYFASVYRDTERRLLASRIGTTIIRCGLYSDFVLEHWLKPGEIAGEMLLPAGDGRVAPISGRDVAAVIVAVAAGGGSAGGSYTVTGPEALGFAEIAALYEAVVARPMRYRACSVEAYLRAVAGRLEAPWPLAFASLGAAIGEGRWVAVSREFCACHVARGGGFWRLSTAVQIAMKNSRVMSIQDGAVRRCDAGPMGLG